MVRALDGSFIAGLSAAAPVPAYHSTQGNHRGSDVSGPNAKIRVSEVSVQAGLLVCQEGKPLKGQHLSTQNEAEVSILRWPPYTCQALILEKPEGNFVCEHVPVSVFIILSFVFFLSLYSYITFVLNISLHIYF